MNRRGAMILGGFIATFIATVIIVIVLVSFAIISSVIKTVDGDAGGIKISNPADVGLGGLEGYAKEGFIAEAKFQILKGESRVVALRNAGYGDIVGGTG